MYSPVLHNSAMLVLSKAVATAKKKYIEVMNLPSARLPRYQQGKLTRQIQLEAILNSRTVAKKGNYRITLKAGTWFSGSINRKDVESASIR